MNILRDNRGFTLIELLVVVAILAVMTVVALPRISGFINIQRQHSALLTAYVRAVSEDSFIHRRTNYLCVQLNRHGIGYEDPIDREHRGENSIITFSYIDNVFKPNSRKVLNRRNFSSSFILDAVILEGGRVVDSGSVLIPFYSDGSSETFTIRIISEGDIIYLKKDRNNKDAVLAGEV